MLAGVGLQLQGYTLQSVDSAVSELSTALPADTPLAELGILRQELGEIPMSQGNTQLAFQIKNTTVSVLDLQQLYTTCMCTKAKLITAAGQSSFAGMQGHTSGLMPIDPNLQLQPGEEAVLLVDFDPNAHGPQGVGPITRSVILETNQQPMEFTFTGVVTNS